MTYTDQASYDSMPPCAARVYVTWLVKSDKRERILTFDSSKMTSGPDLFTYIDVCVYARDI